MYGGEDEYDPFAEEADYEPFQEEPEPELELEAPAAAAEALSAGDGRAGVVGDEAINKGYGGEGGPMGGASSSSSSSSSSPRLVVISVGQKRRASSSEGADLDPPHTNNGNSNYDNNNSREIRPHRSNVPVVTSADRSLWKDCWRVVQKRLVKHSREGRVPAGDVDRLAKKLAQKVFEKERCRERRKAAAEAEAEAAWRAGTGALSTAASASGPAAKASTSTDTEDTAGSGVVSESVVLPIGGPNERSSLDAAGELRVREYVRAYFDKFGSYSSNSGGSGGQP